MTDTPRPTDDGDVAAWARDLGIPGILDIHVHFMPDRMQQAVWRHFDSLARPWGIRYRTNDAARLRTLADLGVVRHTALAYAHKPGMAAWLNEFTLDFAERNPSALPCLPSTLSRRRRPTSRPRWPVAGPSPRSTSRWASSMPPTRCWGRSGPSWPEQAPRWSSTRGRCRTARAGRPGAGWRRCAGCCSAGRAWSSCWRNMGAPDYRDAVQLARDFPQLFMDTAMVLVDGGRFEYPHLLLDWLAASPRRVLFGSDFPAFPHDFAASVRGIVACGFGDAWLRQVFWDNAARLLPAATGGAPRPVSGVEAPGPRGA